MCAEAHGPLSLDRFHPAPESAVMNYAMFKKIVTANGWTLRTLRCDDAPPPAEMLELMDRVGLAKYERFVLRFEREQSK